MIDIEAKCKLCQKPLYLQMDPDCEDHWRRVFLSMVTCDRCFDLRETRLHVTGKLQAIAQYVMALDVHILKPEDRRDKKAKAKDRLLHWTRLYANWFSDFHGRRQHVVWNEEFAQMILDKPNKLDEVLRQYRANARRIIQEDPQPEYV